MGKVENRLFMAELTLPAVFSAPAGIEFKFDLVRVSEIADYYRTRWAIPRAERRPEFREWSRDHMRLIPQLQRERGVLRPI